MTATTLAVPLAALAIVLAIVAWRARREARRLAESLDTLADVLERFAQGEVQEHPTVDAAMPPASRRALLAASRQGDLLAHERQAVTQSALHLRSLLRAIDAVVFTLDTRGQLTWCNRRAVERFALHASPVGRPVADTPLGVFVPDTWQRAAGDVALCEIPSATGPTVWQRYIGQIDQPGRRETLVAATDISAAMRRGEERAFSRLVRVLSHELNNSLAPIASVTGSVADRLDALHDAAVGDSAVLLRAVGARAQHLAAFVGRFAHLADLPAPRPAPVAVDAMMRGLAATLPDGDFSIEPGPPIVLRIDRSQVEQALVNLLTNAVQAGADRGSRQVIIRWRVADTDRRMAAGVYIDIDDHGPGVQAARDLFVPFFSTRPNGRGVGLFLSRQLVEMNGGALTLTTRPDGSGARAQVVFPLALVVAEAEAHG